MILPAPEPPQVAVTLGVREPAYPERAMLAAGLVPPPLLSEPLAPLHVQVLGVLPSADLALSGLQDAASVRRAISDLYEQGHRTIGIGRHGALEIAQTEHAQRIELPDGVVVIGGHVRNGLWHAGNGCRVLGGYWERDDPRSTDAAMFRVGDVGEPREDVVLEGVRTRIGPDAGASVFPYDIRNGGHVRVLDCRHISEAPKLGPDQGGGAGSGQAFCVGSGAWDVTIRGNVAEVMAEDDFVNFGSRNRRSGRIRVLNNVIKGFENLAAASDCEGMYVAGNVGENVCRAFMGKAAWFQEGPALVRSIALAHNQLFDEAGLQWWQVAMLLAGEGGVLEDVTIDGVQVHATPASGASTNLVQAIAREGGTIRDIRATNVNVTTPARLERLLSTRGPGVMQDFELYDWRVVCAEFGQCYDLQGGFALGSLYHHNVRVRRTVEAMAGPGIG